MSVDVLQLIDRLEALISSGARLPLTSRALVDEQEVLDILDQLRMAVPEEIRQAKRLSQERERLLLQ
ncbi:MAG: ATPase, partial [Chloroflexota bacterium]